tara:strand:+ start:916 stop:1113 length:198 start_codon:yes stop_codon:yes gene_type:complete
VITDEASPTTTVGELVNNPNFKAILKHGESVDAIVNGTVMSFSTPLSDLGPGVVISLETKSNSKA